MRKREFLLGFLICAVMASTVAPAEAFCFWPFKKKKKPQSIVIDAPVNKNIGLTVGKDGVVSSSTRSVDAIYPDTKSNAPGISFPGNRGTNQLVIYKRDWGRRTGTNEFGKEAVVQNETVTALTGADSIIPSNGYVISGHGEAKKWISSNLRVGTNVVVDNENMKISAYTTVESYRYFARSKINEVEKLLKDSKMMGYNVDTKTVKEYLKKAKSQLSKSDDDDQNSLVLAVAAAENAQYAMNASMPYMSKELKGVWLRPTEKNKSEVESTLNELQKTGINAVFVETYFHGKTIYPSRVMQKYGFSVQNPSFKGYDPLSVWVKEGKKRNIATHVWFESFYIGNNPPKADPENILSVKPEWGNKNKANADSNDLVRHAAEHSGYFLDPANPQVTEFLTDLILEISGKYDINGVNLDYVRYPLSAKPTSSRYESSNWGYTKAAIEEFKSIYGVDPIEIKYGTQMWKNWDKYRQDKITNYVAGVKDVLKDRNIMISAVVFPDEENCVETKQQDWGKWSANGYVDAITPLILTSDAALSTTMMKNIRKKASSSTKIMPGLFVGFMEGEPEDLLRQIYAARSINAEGVILFDYAHLAPKYTDVLKFCVFKEKCE